MTEDWADPEGAGPLRALGQVEPPGPGVLDAAREALWSAVAEEMLSAGPAAVPAGPMPGGPTRPGQTSPGKASGVTGANPARDQRGQARGGLLWQRNFRLLWTRRDDQRAGNAMAAVAVPLLAVAVLHASTLRGGSAAGGRLPALAGHRPAGRRLGGPPARAAIMIGGDVIRALLFLVPFVAWVAVLSAGKVLALAFAPAR